MPATPRRTFRLTDADLDAIGRLGRLWGPVEPLGATAVIREAVRRCLDMETRRAKSKAGNKPRAAGEG
jgi:hypothetical protein